MAKRHNDRDGAQDDPNREDATQGDPTETEADGTTRNEDVTTGQDETTEQESGTAGGTHAVTRRSFAKAVGAAAALGGGASLMGSAAAVSDLDAALEPNGEVTLEAGEYAWSGSGLDVGSGDALVGGGSEGDVVLNLESGTMDGSVQGRLENVVVRGQNHEAKSGINVHPGATVDGFVWPEGGQQSEDRALYTPDGGNDRLTIQNSAWAWMVNNGAYVDKPPVTMENCAAINNNIANVRVGHRDGTSEDETTYVRNTLIAVTDDILNDDTNSPNARGLRLRSPANLVVENCWFVYLDVSGTADLIELHDEAAGSTVTIRDCAFYNDSNGDLVRDKSGGEMDVTIENCTVAGSGSRTIEPDYSGSGVTEDDSVAFPLPSDITGYAVADDIEGVGDGIGPWDGSVSTSSTTDDHTLVLHASPDNDSAVDVSFTVDGDLEFAEEAEPDTDTIVTNDDGTMTATSVGLDPDELDSYRYTGSVVDYSVPDGAVVDVSVDGTTTSFEEIVGDSNEGTSDGEDSSDGEDVLEVVARQSGDLNYEFVVDGSVELHETSDQIVAGHGDEITQNDDGTVTVTGFTGNDGYGDAYLVSGSILSFSWSPEDYDFDVILNGETVDPTSFEESGDSTSDDSTSDDSTSDDSTSDDSTSDDSTSDDSTSDDSTSDDSTSADSTSDDSTSDDSTSDDSTSDDSTTDDSTSGDSGSTDEEPPHLLTVDGNDGYDVTTYTFTVSGDVVRDETLSAGSENGTNWHEVEDFARDGKVIGLVGGGVDAYRFSGNVTEITVDGTADVSIDWNA